MEGNGHRHLVAPLSIDAAVEECVVARRNFLLGLWAGRQIGLTEDLLGDYARSVVAADYEEPGCEDVIRKLEHDFRINGLALTRGEIDFQLCRARGIAASHLAESD